MDWLKVVHGTAETAPHAFGPGDEVRVWYRILEQGKERLGQFEGIVIRCRGSGPSSTFTVRRVTHGEGVERVFPFDAKIISRIEVLRRGRVRRSRLYYLRTVIGKTRIASAGTESSAEPTAASVPVVDKTTEAEAAPEKAESVAAAADNPAPSNPSTRATA